MTRAIVTLATGPHQALLEIALPTFDRFAQLHGYEVMVADVDDPTPRPPSWMKVPALLAALELHDEALWLDADTVIVDPELDLPVPGDDFWWQANVRHHTADGEVPNCGVWMVRKPMIPYLQRAWSMSQHRDHPWWEQGAICELLGYSPNTRPLFQGPPTTLYDHTWWLEPAWNVHVNDSQVVEHPRIQHATMRADREGMMRAWATG